MTLFTIETIKYISFIGVAFYKHSYATASICVALKHLYYLEFMKAI